MSGGSRVAEACVQWGSGGRVDASLQAPVSCKANGPRPSPAHRVRSKPVLGCSPVELVERNALSAT